MTTFDAGVGISTAGSASVAVQEAVRKATASMGTVRPQLAFVTATVDHDAQAVHDALRAALPGTKIHGVTTSLGVLGGAGVAMGPSGAVGVLLLGGEGLRFATGSAPIGDDPVAAGRQAAGALGAERPALLFFNASPGCEEAVLKGVMEVVPGVPIYGGSAADHAIAGEWSVFTDDGVHGNAVSVAGVIGDLRIGAAFLAPYRATDATAQVSQAEGRSLLELDGQPAAEKLREWVGPVIEPQLESGGNILAQTALRPLGIRHETDRGDFYLTIHPANVRADDGAVELFARVAQGQSVCAMEATVGELVGSLDRLIAEARADGGFEQNQPQAGVLIYCAGCAGAAGTELDAGLRQAWESSLPGVPLLGLCTYWSTPGGRATTCHNSSLGPPRVCDSTCTST